jgi:hypothetical protein
MHVWHSLRFARDESWKEWQNKTSEFKLRLDTLILTASRERQSAEIEFSRIVGVSPM